MKLKEYSQFEVERDYFFDKLDFVNWYRFFFIIKELLRARPKIVLEIGEGSGIVRRVVEPLVEKYETMDVNEKLNPNYLNDVRIPRPELKGKFDCTIAADILEHIPFEDLKQSLINLHAYLKPKGITLITIPHRASNFLWMTPTQIPHPVRVPTGFLSLGGFYRRFIKRRIWIDPDHQWEIGDGRHSVKDVETAIKDAGFKIIKRQSLVYVDFWVLSK